VMLHCRMAPHCANSHQAMTITLSPPSSYRGSPDLRPASAASVYRPIAFHGYCYTPELENTATQRPASATTARGVGGRRRTKHGWTAASSVPRTFDMLAMKDQTEPDEFARKWGPQEAKFRKAGMDKIAHDQEELRKEAEHSRDGRQLRQLAEQTRQKNCHAISGEPWRHPRHSTPRNTPQHLAGSRIPSARSGSFLFSDHPLLEASESAMRWNEAKIQQEIQAQRCSAPPPKFAGRTAARSARRRRARS